METRRTRRLLDWVCLLFVLATLPACQRTIYVEDDEHLASAAVEAAAYWEDQIGEKLFRVRVSRAPVAAMMANPGGGIAITLRELDEISGRAAGSLRWNSIWIDPIRVDEAHLERMDQGEGDAAFRKLVIIIAHEIGHFYLGHEDQDNTNIMWSGPMDPDRNTGLSDHQRDTFRRRAKVW